MTVHSLPTELWQNEYTIHGQTAILATEWLSAPWYHHTTTLWWRDNVAVIATYAGSYDAHKSHIEWADRDKVKHFITTHWL